MSGRRWFTLLGVGVWFSAGYLLAGRFRTASPVGDTWMPSTIAGQSGRDAAGPVAVGRVRTSERSEVWPLLAVASALATCLVVGYLVIGAAISLAFHWDPTETLFAASLIGRPEAAAVGATAFLPSALLLAGAYLLRLRAWRATWTLALTVGMCASALLVIQMSNDLREDAHVQRVAVGGQVYQGKVLSIDETQVWVIKDDVLHARPLRHGDAHEKR